MMNTMKLILFLFFILSPILKIQIYDKYIMSLLSWNTLSSTVGDFYYIRLDYTLDDVDIYGWNTGTLVWDLLGTLNNANGSPGNNGGGVWLGVTTIRVGNPYVFADATGGGIVADIDDNGIYSFGGLGSTVLHFRADIPPWQNYEDVGSANTPSNGQILYAQLTIGSLTGGNGDGPRLGNRIFLAGNPICFRGDSLVETNVGPKKASEIKKGDLVLSTTRGYVEVVNNIITFNTKEIFLLKKGCLGQNTPSEDFYATGGHPISLNGKEIIVQDLPEAEKIETENETVYSIATTQREYIKINGLDVCTWDIDEWSDSKVSKQIPWGTQ
jgi:hypothetical protein